MARYFLALAGMRRSLFKAASRQNHLVNSQLEGSLFVGAIPEASVSSSQSWSSTKELHMCLERRNPLLLIAEIAAGHSIIAYKPVFDFVNTDQAAEFIGLVSLTLCE
jgi:hypothetical protein